MFLDPTLHHPDESPQWWIDSHQIFRRYVRAFCDYPYDLTLNQTIDHRTLFYPTASDRSGGLSDYRSGTSQDVDFYGGALYKDVSIVVTPAFVSFVSDRTDEDSLVDLEVEDLKVEELPLRMRRSVDCLGNSTVITDAIYVNQPDYDVRALHIRVFSLEGDRLHDRYVVESRMIDYKGLDHSEVGLQVDLEVQPFLEMHPDWIRVFEFDEGNISEGLFVKNEETGEYVPNPGARSNWKVIAFVRRLFEVYPDKFPNDLIELEKFRSWADMIRSRDIGQNFEGW